MREAQGARHVLVLEDDPGYRRLVNRMLRRAGFRVSVAGNFAEAIELVEGPEPIDLLLADIGMPDGTPHGFSAGAVAQRARPGLKVIYMTGGQDPSQFSLHTRSHRLLLKPLRPDELVEAIAAVLAEG